MSKKIVYYKYLLDGWVCTPSRRWDKLTPSERIVYGYLLSKSLTEECDVYEQQNDGTARLDFEKFVDLNGKKGFINTNDETVAMIAERLNMTRKGVYLCLQSLYARGLLTKDFSSVYFTIGIFDGGYFQLFTDKTIKTMKKGELVEAKVSGQFLVVYSYLRDRCKLSNGNIRIKTETIAEKFKVSVRAVRNMLDKMIDNDLVERHKDGSYRFL